jgi:hypothetical protein
MTMLEAAREIVNQLNTCFTKAGVKAIATLDPTEVSPRVHANQVAAIVTAPDYRFTGISTAEAEWEIWLIAPGAQDLEGAWETLETALEAFRAEFQVTEVKPATYQPANGATYPALIANFESVHQYENQ